MKKIKQLIMATLLVAGFGLVAAPATVGAVNAIDSACTIDPNSVICNNKGDTPEKFIGNVVNTLLFLIGIAAVIVLIIGGITYTTSAGNSESIKRAKNMILYAVIGLVVAFAAYALLNWVLGAFTPPVVHTPAHTP